MDLYHKEYPVPPRVGRLGVDLYHKEYPIPPRWGEVRRGFLYYKEYPIPPRWGRLGGEQSLCYKQVMDEKYIKARQLRNNMTVN